MGEILKTYHPTAKAQEAKVDALYAEYEKAAGALAKLVTETHFDEVEARAKDPMAFRKLSQAKEKAFNAWQAAAMRHGHMFTGQ